MQVKYFDFFPRLAMHAVTHIDPETTFSFNDSSSSSFQLHLKRMTAALCRCLPYGPTHLTSAWCISRTVLAFFFDRNSLG